MLDAYTVRKAIPRILLAVIGINLSIYLCVAAVDITNIIGRGLGDLITTPFLKDTTFGDESIGGTTGNIVGGSVFALGALVGGAAFASPAAATLIGGVAIKAGIGLIGVLIPFAITVGLITLAILFTLIIRQGLLIFLTIISPVAIALFVLPGTEKYFKKWLDLYVKTLLVYPIIASLFAVSTAMVAILIGTAGDSPGGVGLAKVLGAVIVAFAPLVMIPFAFKLAGGAISAVMNAASGTSANLAGRAGKRFDAWRKDPNTLLGNFERDQRNRYTNRRSELANDYKQAGSDTNRSARQRRMSRAMGTLVGGTNIEARASALRAETAKIMNDQIATGRDEEIRGLSVNKTVADKQAMSGVVDDEGNQYTTAGKKESLRRITKDGTMEYKTLGGAWVSEGDVIKGQSRWGNDAYAQQASLSYEMRKAASNEEVEGIRTRYEALSTGYESARDANGDVIKDADGNVTKTYVGGGWGLSSGTAAGVLKGAGFENQNKHLEFKHSNIEGGINYEAFAKEAYENRGSYNMAQMSAHTIERLDSAYSWAEENGRDDVKQQVQGIAETFMYRGGAGGPIGEADDTQVTDPAALARAQATGGGGVLQTNTPGSASVAESVRKLAVRTGVYTPELGRPKDQSTGPKPDFPLQS